MEMGVGLGKWRKDLFPPPSTFSRPLIVMYILLDVYILYLVVGPPFLLITVLNPIGTGLYKERTSPTTLKSIILFTTTVKGRQEKKGVWWG
jgi:hypothetical protein